MLSGYEVPVLTLLIQGAFLAWGISQYLSLRDEKSS
jgi:hypothetical protein